MVKTWLHVQITCDIALCNLRFPTECAILYIIIYKSNMGDIEISYFFIIFGSIQYSVRTQCHFNKSKYWVLKQYCVTPCSQFRYTTLYTTRFEIFQILGFKAVLCNTLFSVLMHHPVYNKVGNVPNIVHTVCSH